jgi:DNA-binding transcriptional LysR family regulator
MADEYLRRHGIRPKVRFELDGIEHIVKLVSEGLGVSLLPEWPVIGPPDPSVKKWPLPRPFPTRIVGVLWVRATVRAPLVDIFIRLASG